MEPAELETLPSRTVVFGVDNQRRMWSGEARNQAAALHVKQLDTLREVSSVVFVITSSS